MKPTPRGVDRRVFHEDDMRPGSICRRWSEADGGWEPREWFIVVSEPKTARSTGAEWIHVVYLDGLGGRDRLFLSDLGAKPPHRGVTEKHDLEVPEEHIASSWLQRVLP